MQHKHKKRLIITLQLKNAEVYPGSNLHGTVILQLMHKHNHSHHHRHRTPSIESQSVDLTPRLESYSSAHPSFNNIGSLTIIDRVSISVTGICNINESVTEREHFPSHLKLENDDFNILSGKENILGKALQFGEDENESIQFDFVVQLPPVLPCSYCGYFIQYLYYAQLFVSITKQRQEATKCRVPFYVLPAKHKEDIPHLLTPKDLQERMSIFRMRKKSLYTRNISSSISSSSSSSSYSSPAIKRNISILLPPADRAHFVENDLLSTTNKRMEEKNNISSYLNSNALYLNYRGSNEINDTDEFELNDTNNYNNNNNKFRISLDNKEIGVLLLNNTIFGDGQCIEGYLSLSTPCIVRVTLVHCEHCGTKQTHFTNCASYYQCCWFLPSFSFNLKIPNNAFKSFESDLCQSKWSLNFQFAINKYLLSNKPLISSINNKKETLYVNNPETDVWKIYEMDKKHTTKNVNAKKANQRYEIDKILNWNLPIIVTTIHNPLRCVTRSNAVIVKC